MPVAWISIVVALSSHRSNRASVFPSHYPAFFVWFFLASVSPEFRCRSGFCMGPFAPFVCSTFKKATGWLRPRKWMGKPRSWASRDSRKMLYYLKNSICCLSCLRTTRNDVFPHFDLFCPFPRFKHWPSLLHSLFLVGTVLLADREVLQAEMNSPMILDCMFLRSMRACFFWNQSGLCACQAN